jgi:hypothetical protein
MVGFILQPNLQILLNTAGTRPTPPATIDDCQRIVKNLKLMYQTN